MKVLAKYRQSKTRKWLKNSLHIDIGSGIYPMPNSLTFDIEIKKSPDIVANALNIPLQDHSVSTITALEIFEHFHREDQLKFLSECERILEKKGRLIISIPNYSGYGLNLFQNLIWFIREHTTQSEYLHGKSHTHIGNITPRELRSLLTKLGFRILHSQRIALYDFLIIAENTALITLTI